MVERTAKPIRVAAGLLLIGLLAWPASAAEERKTLPEAAGEAAELAKRAAEKIMGALQGVIETLPQYEAPEMQPNGDILIRRKQRPEIPDPKKAPNETST